MAIFKEHFTIESPGRPAAPRAPTGQWAAGWPGNRKRGGLAPESWFADTDSCRLTKPSARLLAASFFSNLNPMGRSRDVGAMKS